MREFELIDGHLREGKEEQGQSIKTQEPRRWQPGGSHNFAEWLQQKEQSTMGKIPQTAAQGKAWYRRTGDEVEGAEVSDGRIK